MKLSVPANTPILYAQDGVQDPIVYAVYCHPFSTWTWFVLEHHNGECFGLVSGYENELGYFHLQELEQNNVIPLTPWKPIPLSEAKILVLGDGIDMDSAA